MGRHHLGGPKHCQREHQPREHRVMHIGYGLRRRRVRTDRRTGLTLVEAWDGTAWAAS